LSLPVATPERASGKAYTAELADGRKVQSPVTPIFAHQALGMTTARSQGNSLDRPIRLRQLSSGSNGSLHRDASHSQNRDPIIPPTDDSTYVAIGPDSPLRHRNARSGHALGSLTQKFWSPRARQPSDASQDGYLDGSDDQDIHS
jgi:hypothetical protein